MYDMSFKDRVDPSCNASYFDYAEGKFNNSIVYLVDDDYDDRLYAYSMLKRSAMVSEVRAVKSGDTLFKCFENTHVYDSSILVYQPTIIMLDMHMPGRDGLETLAQIRENPITAKIPVILLTTDMSDDKIAKAYELKANGYITKPFNVDHFNKIMESGWGWDDNAQAVPMN